MVCKGKTVRRLLAALALLCLALGLTGCGMAQEEARPPYTVVTGDLSGTVVSGVPGLSLRLDAKEYTGPDVKVRFALQNGTDTTYSFGPMGISMEVLQDGEWYSLARRTDVDVASTGDAIGVGPNAGTEETPRFYWASFLEYGDIVPPGTYRLIVGCSRRRASL